VLKGEAEMTPNEYTLMHKANPKHLTKTGKISNKKPAKLKLHSHWHRCPKIECLTFWQHSEGSMLLASDCEFRTAHKCPKCGTMQLLKWLSSRDNLKT
jgi:hypothetical protein